MIYFILITTSLLAIIFISLEYKLLKIRETLLDILEIQANAAKTIYEFNDTLHRLPSALELYDMVNRKDNEKPD